MTLLYPIAKPILNGNEKAYVNDCLDSSWISSGGRYIEMFEQRFAEYCGVRHAVSCNNGTAALHIALLAHGVGRGDEVIIPSLTFVATANAVTYCGAVPVFIDCEPDTWNIDPEKIQAKITPRTKGIIAVHLYGHPVEMAPILELANRYGLFVLEDAAEALGAEYRGLRAGSIGHSGTFSLFGNKIITTGEGGMLTTNDDKIAEAARQYKGQGIHPKRKYWFPVIGYNYRMTNIQAAIGCAQLENVEWHIHRRREVARQYLRRLEGCECITLPVERYGVKNVYWMFSVLVNDADESVRDKAMAQLAELGIETRPFFYPMHILPPYRHLQPMQEFPNVNRIAASGFNIPSHGELNEDDIDFISRSLLEVVTNL
jgi:perosamine synthetase